MNSGLSIYVHFGKIGRLASEVVLQLIKSKCIPILLYGLEPFDLSTRPTGVRSLDFVINRFFMKLFKTTSTEIIRLSQTYLCFKLPSVLLKKERKNLERSTTNIITLATICR